MSLVNKFTKSLRWLRWSTVCAILFYAFFIGLILHSTTYKIQHTFKSRNHPQKQQNHHQHQQKQGADEQQEHQEHQELQQHQQGSHEQFFNDIKQQLNSVNSNNPPQKIPLKPQKLTYSNGVLQQQASQGGGGVEKGKGVLKDALGKTIRNGRIKPGEPETVILAVSSVNEKKILEKAFNR